MNFRKLILLVLIAGILSSCSDSEDSDPLGNWVKKSDFEGVTRAGAISMKIGDYAYVGLGSDGDDYLKDFWRYDASLNYWQRMADFPGAGRISAVSFTAAGKGYLGTGFNDDLDVEELSDFWEYDPETNAWTQIDSIPDGGRYGAVSFALNDEGYVGTGYNGNYLKDFWKYSPETGEWTNIVSLYGSKRQGAMAFVIDDKAYVCGGRNNGSYVYDFYAYDAESGIWEDLALTSDDDTYSYFLVAVARYNAVAFSVDGLGYIATGVSDSYTSTIYSYDPVTNEWDDDITSFEGASRSTAVSFVIDNAAYIATGRNSSLRFDDIWLFQPSEEYDEYD